jgi:rare lipoprotein A
VASLYWPGDGVVKAWDHRTASGERLDVQAMTCAHKTLPFGTVLYLSRGDNHAEVRITDRGPFVRGRSLDCTPAVGKALHLDLGSVHVEPWPPLPKERPQ